MTSIQFIHKRFLFVCVFAALLPVILSSRPLLANDGIAVQAMAPDFTLPDLNGKMVSLSDFRGKLVLVDFWATWCVPCRKSMPELAALEKKYRDRGLVVLGLSIDNPESFSDQFISDFIKKFDVEYTILRAGKPIIDQYLGKDNPTVPTLFFIDGQGKIQEKHEGFIAGELEPLLQNWLK